MVVWSCRNSDTVWLESYNFKGNRWVAENRLSFTPDTPHLSKKEALKAVFLIRYGRDAFPSSFPLVLETESPSTGEFSTDTLKVNLLPEGERNGETSKMGIFETCDTITLAHRPLPGWSMTLYPEPDLTIDGIFSITVQLIEK